MSSTNQGTIIIRNPYINVNDSGFLNEYDVIAVVNIMKRFTN